MTDDSGVSRRLKKHPCQGILTGVLFLVLYESVVDIVNRGVEGMEGGVGVEESGGITWCDYCGEQLVHSYPTYIRKHPALRH